MRKDFFDAMDLDGFSADRLAYIRAVSLDEARALGAIIPSEIKLSRDMKLYALCASDGTAIGITDNWAAAYGAAVQNNFVPVSVH